MERGSVQDAARTNKKNKPHRRLNGTHRKSEIIARNRRCSAPARPEANNINDLQTKMSEVRKSATLIDDLPLFSARAAPIPPRISGVEERIAEIFPDGLTPRDALDLVFELKALSDQSRPKPTQPYFFGFDDTPTCAGLSSRSCNRNPAAVT